MMKRNNIDYAWWGLASDILGVPVFTVKAIKRLIKKEKIADSLEKIIEEAKKEAKTVPQKELTSVKIQLLRDSYEEQDDFFSVHFKSKSLQKLSFDEKIDYCLEKYKEESRKISTATNSLILEKNFFKGAKQTLFLYFFFHYHNIDIESEGVEEKTIIQQINQAITHNDYRTIENKNITKNFTQNIDRSITNNDNSIQVGEKLQVKDPSSSEEKMKNNGSFRAIFTNPSDSDIFLSLLDEKFRTASGKLEIKKTLVASFLNELRIRKVIKDIDLGI